MEQKVVVIGHSYTSRLGVIRALGREGYEVIVIVITGYKRNGETLNMTKPIDCYSKYVSRVLFCPSNRERLVQLLLSECVDPQKKVVVIPDSDFSAAVVDVNSEQLSEHFLFPHINHKPGEIVTWMDKFKQKGLAESVGLSVAKGWRVEVVDGNYSIPSNLQYPCFPKPLATIAGGKRGLRRCDDKMQLCSVIDGIAALYPNINILVEEYKIIEEERAMMGVSDGWEVVIPGIIETISLAQGAHYGVARKGRVVPVGYYHDFVEKCKRLVQLTGFVGIFDIDFFKSGSEYYFCEINFRYGGSGYAYTTMGANLPVEMVKMLNGMELKKELCPVIKDIALFVNERMCKDDWAEGYLSTRELMSLLRSSAIRFVYDDDDPVPGREFSRSLLNLALNFKRIVKRLLRR